MVPAFSIITRKALKKGSFSFCDDLVSKLMRYIEIYNKNGQALRLDLL